MSNNKKKYHNWIEQTGASLRQVLLHFLQNQDTHGFYHKIMPNAQHKKGKERAKIMSQGHKIAEVAKKSIHIAERRG